MSLLCGIWRLALLTWLRNGRYRVSSIDWCAVDCSEWWYRDLRVRTFWWTSFGRIRLRWERRGSEKRVHEAPCKEPVLRRKSQLLEQEVSGVQTDFGATVLQNQRNLDIEADSEGHFGPSFSSQTPFRGIVF